MKLGSDLGYLKLQDFYFNELIVCIQSAFLYNDEDEDDEKSVNEKRADILRAQTI